MNSLPETARDEKRKSQKGPFPSLCRVSLSLTSFFQISPLLGEMIQFDEHIFQMGWFNHQLVTSSLVVRFLERFFFVEKTLQLHFWSLLRL